jgi:REP element-mobilizing transposase RayT
MDTKVPLQSVVWQDTSVVGEVFHSLARQKESKILEGHLQADHVHVLISIPPKYSVAQVVGLIKGKSAIHGKKGTGCFSHTVTPPRFISERKKSRTNGNLPKERLSIQDG